MSLTKKVQAARTVWLSCTSRTARPVWHKSIIQSISKSTHSSINLMSLKQPARVHKWCNFPVPTPQQIMGKTQAKTIIYFVTPKQKKIFFGLFTDWWSLIFNMSVNSAINQSELEPKTFNQCYAWETKEWQERENVWRLSSAGKCLTDAKHGKMSNGCQVRENV